MTKRALQLEIERLANEIAEREKQMDGFEEQLCKIESREYIEKHGITLEDVDTLEGMDFEGIREVQMYLYKIGFSAKKWVSWRRKIYKTKDLMDSVFIPTPARMCDLEEEQEAYK